MIIHLDKKSRTEAIISKLLQPWIAEESTGKLLKAKESSIRAITIPEDCAVGMNLQRWGIATDCLCKWEKEDETVEYCDKNSSRDCKY